MRLNEYPHRGIHPEGGELVMVYYFVDYENVKDDGLNDIQRIKREDRVVIFYSDNTPRMGSGVVEKMLGKKLNVKMYKAVTGHKDSLDHQLSASLGMAMKGNTEDDFCIISGDTAFDDLMKFLKKKRYHVYRVSQLSDYFRIKLEEECKKMKLNIL